MQVLKSVFFENRDSFLTTDFTLQLVVNVLVNLRKKYEN